MSFAKIYEKVKIQKYDSMHGGYKKCYTICNEKNYVTTWEILGVHGSISLKRILKELRVWL